MPTAPNDQGPHLANEIVSRLLTHIGAAPCTGGPVPVVRFAAPDTITNELDETVGLGFADDAPAHRTDDLLAAVTQVIDRSVRTDHPMFINQNFAGTDPVGVVGDWLGAVLNTSVSTYEIAPVITLMERVVLDKLARLAGFPTENETGLVPGMFTAGGSLAMLQALQLARHRARPEVLSTGSDGRPTRILVGSSGHYATSKAAAVMGIGIRSVLKVPCDATGAMKPEALADMLKGSEGVIAVVATAGTTVTGAFDPIDAIARICTASDIWLHVDGAYGASALFSARQCHRLAGVERADSLNWNLHKMMGMTQQCSTLLVREPQRLHDTFACGADYLFQPDKQHRMYDLGDSGFMCGRRADVLKLWLTWKTRGDTGFAERVDHAVAVADHVRERIRQSSDHFAAIVEGTFTNVCVTWVPPELRPLRLTELKDDDRRRLNALAPRIKARMQTEGSALIGFQPVNGLNCFRLIFISPRTTAADADLMLELIERYGEEEWSKLAHGA